MYFGKRMYVWRLSDLKRSTKKRLWEGPFAFKNVKKCTAKKSKNQEIYFLYKIVSFLRFRKVAVDSR